MPGVGGREEEDILGGIAGHGLHLDLCAFLRQNGQRTGTELAMKSFKQ